MNMIKRIVIYGLGIFLFALGVALAIKSSLGVSPVSTLPYVVSMMTGYTVGTMTALLYMVFVGLQWLILRKEFMKKDFLQLVFAFVFGFCVDFSTYLILGLRNDNLILQGLYLILGTGIIGLGIFLILKSGLIVSPTDGLVKAISYKMKIGFSKVKVSVDLGAACISAALALVFMGELVGVGIGTLFSAFGVGLSISFFEKVMGHKFSQVELYGGK